MCTQRTPQLLCADKPLLTLFYSVRPFCDCCTAVSLNVFQVWLSFSKADYTSVPQIGRCNSCLALLPALTAANTGPSATRRGLFLVVDPSTNMQESRIHSHVIEFGRWCSLPTIFYSNQFFCFPEILYFLYPLHLKPQKYPSAA